HRYETGSLIITSNQPFSEWGRIFPDEMMTVAAIDRLVHHANLIEVQSDSYRRKAAMRQMAAEQAPIIPDDPQPPAEALVTV
ncbi:MAG: ATP-binding protein, partial [bacterium]|nr:ATP-binding protein [bacterium]